MSEHTIDALWRCCYLGRHVTPSGTFLPLADH